MPTPETRIRPDDIKADRHMFDAFGHNETEVSAGWIVRFCQHRGQGWAPIPLSELEAFYHTRLGRVERFHFNRLTAHGYVTVEGDVVHLTTRFVAQCYAASPATS